MIRIKSGGRCLRLALKTCGIGCRQALHKIGRPRSHFVAVHPANSNPSAPIRLLRLVASSAFVDVRSSPRCLLTRIRLPQGHPGHSLCWRLQRSNFILLSLCILIAPHADLSVICDVSPRPDSELDPLSRTVQLFIHVPVRSVIVWAVNRHRTEAILFNSSHP
jgi:hypothetical protein